MTEPREETFRVAFARALSCCLHEPLFNPTDAAELLYIRHREHESWADSSTRVIAKLKDGNWGLFYAWEDSSGHGCQCDGMTVVEPTLQKLLFHLDEWELRAVLKVDDRTFCPSGDVY